MTETAHTRSRKAALAGLILQALAFVALYLLSTTSGSWAIRAAGWFVLAGVPIWFVTLLVFRQRELAILEGLDLEALRRERERTGGGAAMFEEGGSAALGFRVAEARLRWMERVLIPVFGLLTALLLIGYGSYILYIFYLNQLRLTSGPWATLNHVPFHLVALGVLLLPLFLFSRYASGLARVAEWQLLRGCGAFTLGNALAVGAGAATLAVMLYAENPWWERLLAYVIPVLMVLLGIETLLNLLLEVYRPRTAEKEARAPFDSRILGLISEPGGLAGAIAEALNYQFGFQVSQTWFYQLVQRTFVPLLGVGLLTLWALTTVVIVLPFEHAIVERFGVQQAPEAPLGPGLYFKWPWPFEVARKYNTGELHQIFIGFKQFDAEAKPEDDLKEGKTMQWTDQDHLGQAHFEFLMPTPPDAAARTVAASADRVAGDQSVPVYMLRMNVAVQYRIRSDRLIDYTRQRSDPDQSLRNIAWTEVARLAATSNFFDFLGDKLDVVNRALRERIVQAVDAAKLGLEIVFVGVANAHPNMQVSEAFRDVIKAEQERLAAIRNALVEQTKKLSETAGDRARALLLSAAIDAAREASTAVNDAQRKLGADEGAAGLLAGLRKLTPQFLAAAGAQMELEHVRLRRRNLAEDQEYGLGARQRDIAALAENETVAERAAQAAVAALDEAIAQARTAARDLPAAQADAAVELVRAEVNLKFWNEQLEDQFRALQGGAAAILAEAEAQRWEIQMSNAAGLARVQNERLAYQSAPEIYKTRRYLEVMREGIQRARKVLMMFDASGRAVELRMNAEDQPGLDTTMLPSELPQR